MRWNRPPLAPNRFAKLRPGSIRARGWLREQLRLSAKGLTGKLMDIWPDVGPQSGWLGGSGEDWERGPYYARGLVALAHALGERGLMARAQSWIDWTVQSQREDGGFGPPGNDDWWARMPMLEALRWHAEATGDARVVPFLSRYAQYQHAELPARPLQMWARPRGADNLDSVLWLYNRSGAAHLLTLGDLLHRQTSDWIGEFGRGGAPSEEFEFGHGVNLAQGFKAPAVYYQLSRDTAHLAAVRAGWERVMAHHGQIQGLYSADELLHGRGSTQGTELCAIVELLSSFETALVIGGELWLADAIERIAYNALPAILSADHCGHQYFQLPNQIECTPGARAFWVPHETDLLFGPTPGYGCCAANFHMGWPQLVHHLWLAAPDGLAVPLFAPCTVRALIGGRTVTIDEDTAYPFGDEITFTVRAAEPLRFGLVLRIPGWADAFDIELNGKRAKVECAGTAAARRRRAANSPALAGGVRLERNWNDGDVLRLHLPMRVRLSHWERESVGVERGPLVYALRIGEDWRSVGGAQPFCDYEVHPTTAWNYALIVDPAVPERALRVEQRAGAPQPWAQDGAPVRLRAEGRRVPAWTARDGVSGPIPERPFRMAGSREPLALIPFGCARLRISMFPWIVA
jgi:DUF1680 family protein